ncbi:MAG: hypothetical protein CMO12_02205 [Thaumarchaeota archaeon]|jgi:DNA replication factor GINS|nr:hypothetical protein [Nitrososphaerota archaeon]
MPESLLEKLHQLLLVESSSTSLQQIPHGIYHEIGLRVRTTLLDKSVEEKDIMNKISQKQLDLLLTLSRRLLEVRMGKVLKNANEIHSLTPEEKHVAQSLENYNKRFTKMIQALEHGQTAILEMFKQLVTKESLVTVRFLQPTGPIVGTDLTKYGPFETEDVTVLPIENARPMIQQGTAAEINGSA